MDAVFLVLLVIFSIATISFTKSRPTLSSWTSGVTVLFLFLLIGALWIPKDSTISVLIEQHGGKTKVDSTDWYFVEPCYVATVQVGNYWEAFWKTSYLESSDHEALRLAVNSLIHKNKDLKHLRLTDKTVSEQVTTLMELKENQP